MYKPNLRLRLPYICRQNKPNWPLKTNRIPSDDKTTSIDRTDLNRTHTNFIMYFGVSTRESFTSPHLTQPMENEITHTFCDVCIKHVVNVNTKDPFIQTQQKMPSSTSNNWRRMTSET